MMFVHADGEPFFGIVMAPPHLVEKCARETFLTLPSVRVFLIDDMRNGCDAKQPHGVNEVRLRRGEIIREGLHATLADMRKLGLKRGAVSARKPQSSSSDGNEPSWVTSGSTPI